MIRTQVQLTEEQWEALKQIASRADISMAEVIRRSLDVTIRTSDICTQTERWRRALAVAGRFHADRTDVSANHDAYLAEAYQS